MSQNNNTGSDSVDAQLVELQKSYILKLDHKLQHIIDLWLRYKAQDDPSNTLKEFHRAVHSVAGTASILNISEVSRICTTIEENLILLISKNAHHQEIFSTLEPHIDDLKALLISKNFNPAPIKL
ncbi:Uncharacterised protein [Zhongshania aliphaticivorans]|uniref:HPt domain-containing protein n=1 Tax=Zhongshania aliphaticivorans TaxID=1470434 RepID=A0A5S9Q7P9_9GAMM|nr:Hpt domain-containing protein [Zhongshania aliphaticivorans]CAA0095310.1 Uncharacterised protein [Zhongshania aliphaticivorans]CAA0113126.1 Uncharacterised protein [Zhongshania aliphaticivorans]